MRRSHYGGPSDKGPATKPALLACNSIQDRATGAEAPERSLSRSFESTRFPASFALAPRRFLISTVNGFFRDFIEKRSLSHLALCFDLKRRLLKGAVSNGDFARLHGFRHLTL